MPLQNNMRTKKNKTSKKARKKIVVAVSGYFNPLHVGHLEEMEKARKLGDCLVAIVNNDQQVKFKRQRAVF